jgi:hypothetical protein
MRIKLIITVFVVLLISRFYGFFENFPENPANIATRQNSELYFPGLHHSFHLSNSLLTIQEFDDIFKKNNFLSVSEKEILSKNDLSFCFDHTADILSFGNNSWNVKLTSIILGNANLLDKQYTELILYGNEANKHYLAHSGEGSEAMMLFKTQMNYAYPKPLETQIALLPVKVFFGANINFYLPELYGKLLESTQEFGTLQTGTYYRLKNKYTYSDEDSFGRLSPAFGIGTKVNFLEGTFHLSVDDLFAKLRYKNLSLGTYEKIYGDYS